MASEVAMGTGAALIQLCFCDGGTIYRRISQNDTRDKRVPQTSMREAQHAGKNDGFRAKLYLQPFLHKSRKTNFSLAFLNVG